MLKTRKFFILSLVLTTTRVLSQEYGNFDKDGQSIIFHATEFSIPVSPAFDLLGVNPCLVPKPSLIRNFKVDWSFKTYGLAPNLALQTQPVNELFFNTPKKLNDYRKAAPWKRFLSTLDLSMGTVDGPNDVETNSRFVKTTEGLDSLIITQNNWRLRSFAYAFKLNLYSQFDPLKERKIFSKVLKDYADEKKNLEEELKNAKSNLKLTKDIEEKTAIKSDVESKETELKNLDDRYLDHMKNIVTMYKSEHWNASFVDIAFGQFVDYDNRDSSLFKFANLHIVNSGWAAWLNASQGVGKNILFSGIIKFQTRNNALIDRNTNSIEGGLNMRYGNHRYNIFVELFAPFHLNNEDLLKEKFMSFGGDWRFSRNVILNYGVRFIFSSDNKIDNIVPVVSLSCMMR
ncbi:MAG TPA: hypothetical protein PKK64_07510 [Saprospiraceae bacterium]|nr:hypothetical protein [Saprospiraceae bacterium]HMX89055.1 hypothetical protein [Saprospiraceae bacterium]HMZ40672.1 hypothetical protein [Saprospiraceae bacterium]HNA63933.1 hypothetical protein [Saprospiraceae bacterium]HNB30688.1 hypothetical protein [Saprospiraceae bacterium]